MVEFSNTEYAQDIVADFSDYISYPEEAAKSGEAGKVMLCLHLDRHGRITEAYVMTGSGHPILDGYALAGAGFLQLQQKNSSSLSLPGHRQEAWMALPVDFNKIAGVKESGPPPTPGDCVNRLFGRHIDAADTENLTAAKPASGAPASGQGSLSDDLRQQNHQILRQYHQSIANAMVYPKAAQRDNQSGTTQLCMVIDRQAHILDAAVIGSSGFPLLDGAALIGLARAEFKFKMPALPDQFFPEAKTMLFVIPINWRPFSDSDPKSRQ